MDWCVESICLRAEGWLGLGAAALLVAVKGFTSGFGDSGDYIDGFDLDGDSSDGGGDGGD